MTLSVTCTVVDGELPSENRNGVKSDYIPDPQGSTAALITAEHVITDTFSYWPYGELRSHAGSSVTPYGYTGTLGPYTDSVSNRIYETYRVLRPLTTVWQTVDPLWPTEEPFAYCATNPVSYVDPLGLQQYDPAPGRHPGGASFYSCMQWYASNFPGRSQKQACDYCKRRSGSCISCNSLTSSFPTPPPVTWPFLPPTIPLGQEPGPPFFVRPFTPWWQAGGMGAGSFFDYAGCESDCRELVGQTSLGKVLGKKVCETLCAKFARGGCNGLNAYCDTLESGGLRNQGTLCELLWGRAGCPGGQK